jgi:hypothetical protein
MQVKNASKRQLEQAANSIGARLYGLRALNRKETRWRFVLRPNGSEQYRMIRFSSFYKSGQRKVNAICWHGHREFFRALFRLAPSAESRSMCGHWTAENFESDHVASGRQNVGSRFEPLAREDACDCNLADSTARMLDALTAK